MLHSLSANINTSPGNWRIKLYYNQRDSVKELGRVWLVYGWLWLHFMKQDILLEPGLCAVVIKYAYLVILTINIHDSYFH